MASVPADVSRRSEEEEGNLAGMEQEDVIDLAQHGAGAVPAGDSSANLPEGHNSSSGERLNDVNDEIRDHANASRHAGGSGGQDRSASRPAGAATTTVVKTIGTQKPERKLS
jgi:hypothetical protein